MGTRCRPNGGAVLCFMVVFVVTIISVIVANYSILANEKNMFRLARVSNGTIMFAHISQTPDSKVGIHNSAPEAIFEVTTHENVKNRVRFSRMLPQGGSDNAGPTSLEFGTYRVGSDGKKLWYAGPQMDASLDGKLSIETATFGNSSRRRLLQSTNGKSASLHLNSRSSGDILMGVGGGNLGIGTRYPNQKLDVAGSARVSGSFEMGESLKLGKMKMSDGTPVKGEVRYVNDDFVGYTKDRGWQSLTATVHSEANGTMGFLSYFVGPTATSWASGMGWSERKREFRLQSKYVTDPVATLVLANWGTDYGGCPPEPILNMSTKTYLRTAPDGYFQVSNNIGQQFLSPTMKFARDNISQTVLSVDFSNTTTIMRAHADFTIDATTSFMIKHASSTVFTVDGETGLKIIDDKVTVTPAENFDIRNKDDSSSILALDNSVKTQEVFSLSAFDIRIGLPSSTNTLDGSQTIIKQGGDATPALKIDAADGFVVHDNKLRFIPTQHLKVRNTDDTSDVVFMDTSNKGLESLALDFNSHTIGSANTVLNTINGGVTTIRQNNDVVLHISAPDGLKLTDDKIISVPSNYFSIRNAADFGDVIKVNASGTSATGVIASNTALFMSANTFNIVPTEKIRLRNRDDSSSLLEIDTSVKGSETVSLIGKYITLGNIPPSGAKSEVVTVKADTIKLENSGNIVLKISEVDGFEVKDDNLLMKPENIFQIRNKLDDDYVMQVKTLNSGQEETAIHGKKLAIELRGADSVSTIQAGTVLIHK